MYYAAPVAPPPHERRCIVRRGHGRGRHHNLKKKPCERLPDRHAGPVRRAARPPAAGHTLAFGAPHTHGRANHLTREYSGPKRVKGRAVACDDPGGPSRASIRWDRARTATTVSVLRSKGVGPVAMKMKLLFFYQVDPPRPHDFYEPLSSPHSTRTSLSVVCVQKFSFL